MKSRIEVTATLTVVCDPDKGTLDIVASGKAHPLNLQEAQRFSDALEWCLLQMDTSGDTPEAIHAAAEDALAMLDAPAIDLNPFDEE